MLLKTYNFSYYFYHKKAGERMLFHPLGVILRLWFGAAYSVRTIFLVAVYSPLSRV